VKRMIDNSELSNSVTGEQAVVSPVQQELMISIDRLLTGLLPGWLFGHRTRLIDLVLSSLFACRTRLIEALLVRFWVLCSQVERLTVQKTKRECGSPARFWLIARATRCGARRLVENRSLALRRKIPRKAFLPSPRPVYAVVCRLRVKDINAFPRSFIAEQIG
jgi:hypothetical protein